MSRPNIAITLGDPRGIGPEVALRAAERFESGAETGSVVIVGPHGPMDQTDVTDYTANHRVGWDTTDSEAGAVAATSLEKSVELALAGEFDGIVTAPVHKPSLQAAGWSVPGQTEMLSDLSQSKPVGMLMAAEKTELGAPLRVLLATTHVPLRTVPSELTAEILEEQAKLLDHTLREDWRISNPRMALCALNPHASDSGLFGSEEREIMEPVVKHLASAGVDIAGPVPADTVFFRALSGEFDAVIAPYHDVGMAAFKTITFQSGVNVTIGLPFVRTSPDHGTAFGIAGTGKADESSMLEALRLAVRLSNARLNTGSSRV